MVTTRQQQKAVVATKCCRIEEQEREEEQEEIDENQSAFLHTKKRSVRRQKGKKKLCAPDVAKTIQQQGDETTWQLIRASLIHMQRALSASFAPDRNNGQHPRVVGILSWKIEVAETPMSGGRVPSHRLRRQQPLVIRMSTNKKDYATLINTLTDENLKSENDVEDFFGFGQEGMDMVSSFFEKRKKKRSKKASVARSLEDTTNSVAMGTFTTEPMVML